MEFEICACCGKPKRPKGVAHPSPTCAARRLDAQSGELNNSKMGARHTGKHDNLNYGFGEYDRGTGYGDSGGASRFFYNVREQIDDADPVRYVAKASRRERDAGLDGFEEKEWWGKGTVKFGETQMDYRQGKEYKNHKTRNTHPTIKPLALTRYLATLLLPPAEYAPRRLFNPFSGVGSESIGASQAGWEFVQGVEITEEYLPIAQARAEYWATKDKQTVMEFA